MAFETVIGLEVHVELSTKTKIFCGCSTEFGGAPNSHVCPGCIGMPGNLPVLNREVVEKALRAGLALHCEINKESVFDRKHYFYPDLPNNYQITQFYKPILTNGWVEIDMGDYKKKIRIHQIHIEEDAGKLVHEGGASLVDLNRCSMPLIEIVSEPDMRNADEVQAYLEKLRETLVYLDVSDCKMEEGSMRADINMSVRQEGAEKLGVRTETKNMNSIKAIRRSIEFEGARHISVIESGGKLYQETRRWDDNKGEGYAMRSKENAQDYRYFPDPDLVPLIINEEWIERTRDAMPELAEAKRARYTSDWDIPEKTAAVLTQEREVAELFEAITDRLGGNKEAAREASNVVTGDILRLMKEDATCADAGKADPDKIAYVLKKIADGSINRGNGRLVIDAIYKEGVDPEEWINAHDLATVSDDSLISEMVAKVIGENPQSVADYKAGKEKSFGFLVGQSMKALQGKASPQDVNAKLKEALEATGLEVKLSDKAVNKNAPKDAIEEPDDIEQDKSSEDFLRKYYDVEQPAWKKALSGGEAPGGEQGRSTSKGQWPIQTSGRYRTKTCGEITEEDIGEEILLAGWVNAVRDHGGILFADLRDQYGITQVVITERMAERLKKESAVSVRGTVVLRDDETINPNLATGRVELKAAELEVEGPCHSSLPFEIDESKDVKEELRLKYRYLDLRNPLVMDKMFLRAEVIKCIRSEMETLHFTEIQTPILANSSPEGARDYLVPSRKHKGMFYALPQAPQQFKQLLMVSGFDRYYQIAPCFRDEDARADRSPGEFYQLDYEMAFATQEDVFYVAEQVMTNTFRKFTDKQVTEPPYVRIPYSEAMLKYGTDKPDLRNPLQIIDLTGYFESINFEPFRGKPVRGIRVPYAAGQSRSWFKNMEQFAFSIGMKGLGYITVQSDGTYKGPIDKFLSDDKKAEIKELAALQADDVLYFICDEPGAVSTLAGKIRTELGERLDLLDKSRYDFCFITNYPMYEWNEDAGKIDFVHNPFSMPQGEMEALMEKKPEDILAWQYDIVCNGVELSSGAVRNHRPDIMVKAFEIAGYDEKTVEEKFGALYTAFGYGAPPHAGMAPGIDRIVMLLSDDDNIREVIVYPLNSNAQNTMLGSPGEVTEQQLREVHIKIR